MRRLENKRQLIEYFKKNLKKGYPLETLRQALLRQGYSKSSIDNSLEEAKKEIAKKEPAIKEKPVIKYQLYDENYKPIKVRRPWWRVLFR
jgi:AAA15 family ATPase/GTPase